MILGGRFPRRPSFRLHVIEMLQCSPQVGVESSRLDWVDVGIGIVHSGSRASLTVKSVISHQKGQSRARKIKEKRRGRREN